MKILLPTLYMLFFLSCSNDTSVKDIKPVTVFRTMDISDNPGIVGSWTMCSSLGNGIMTQYNVCPTVLFKSDGTGAVSQPSLVVENFNWTLQKGKLMILYKDNKSNATFPDTLYFATIKKLDNKSDLIISQQKKDYTFYLSR